MAVTITDEMAKFIDDNWMDMRNVDLFNSLVAMGFKGSDRTLRNWKIAHGYRKGYCIRLITPPMKKFIIDNTMNMDDKQMLKELQTRFDYTGGPSPIHHIRSNAGMNKAKSHCWKLSEEHRKYIKDNWYKLTNAELLSNLKSMGYEGGLSIVRSYCKQQGYLKPKEGCFLKGGYTRKIYEEAYGPIPEGYVVRHMDGNQSNKDPSNLMAFESRVIDKMYKKYGKMTSDAELNLVMLRETELDRKLYDLEMRKKK